MRRFFGILIIAILCATPATAQQRMKVAVIYGTDKPQYIFWERFRERLDARLPGEIAVQIFPNGQLGGEREVAEGAKLGSIQAALSTLANLSAWVPEGQLFDMPFMFRDLGHVERVMAGPVGADFKARYKVQGFHVLGFIAYGARHIVSTVPIEAPADVAGKTMRVIQSPVHLELWRSLGANPTPIPITEAYGALETGVVDYMDMTKSGFEALKLYEVAPVFVETGHIWALGAVYVADGFWQHLTPAQQAAMQATADELIPVFNGLAAAEQDKSLAAALALGAKHVRPDRAPWVDAMAPFWTAYAGKVGGLDKIEAIVATK